MSQHKNIDTTIIEELRKELIELKRSIELRDAEYLSDLSKKNQVIQALKENGNQYLSLYQNAPFNYQSLDSQDCFVDVNTTWLKTLGYKLEEVIGHPFSEFMTVESAEVVKTRFPHFKKAGEIHNFEIEMIRKDGTHLFVNLDGKIGLDEKQNFLQSNCVWTDITSHRIAERTASETSYSELFNTVDDAIYIQAEDGTFLDVNEGAVKMYGYPHEAFIGKNPEFVSAPGKNDMAAISAKLNLAFAGDPQQFEFWGLRSDGEIFPKEIRVVCGTYFGKKVNIAMAQDITNRKQAETALQQSERRYRELIELAVDGILIGSPEGIILQANSYMHKLTGRVSENLIGINVNELFLPNALNDKPLRYDLLKKGKRVITERDIIRPDGTIIPIEMHTRMMPDGTYQSIYRDVTERKKSEEILRQNEEKYKLLVESTSDIIWETDSEGLYTYVSPQFESILGFSPDKTIGKSPYDFISNDLLSKINSQVDSKQDNTTPFYLLVNKFRHRDGHLVHFETSGIPVRDRTGKLTGYRGMSRDISKRYLAEKELYKLSAVVKQSPNTIIITNLDGVIEYINPAGCTVSGYSFEEVVGKNPSIFKSGDTDPNTYKLLWRTIKAGKEWKGIFYNKKKNGEQYCESASVLPIKDAEGNTTHYLAIKEDISKRLQAEEYLKESEERYRELFEASPDAIILADIETGMLVDANTAACKLLGHSLDEIRKLHQSLIHPARDKEFVIKSFRQHAERNPANENVMPIESLVLRSDGSEIPVEVLSNTITLNGRHILQGVFRNITERKQTQEELLRAKEKAEASDKLKSAFLQNITHELRTPLNGIIGFSDMITEMDSSEEDKIEFNKMIKKSSTRLINTITSYMDISMIVSGITEIKKEPFSLTSFLNKIKDQTIDACYQRNLDLEILKKAPEEDIEIVTDENLLTKIFTHLIDNAIKFTKKGSITVAYDFKYGHYHFSVSDTGTGISEEALPVIFEIFRQADVSASREYEGSGLGLSIARGFVKLLGGDIWVESKTDEGSTFFFTIPVKVVETNTLISEQKSSAPDQLVVLVAEDDDSNYKYLEIVLKKASFKVIRSNNGLETIEICRNFPQISVLVTDMKMPGMDGFESTKQIRKLLPLLPIIALSGLISSEDENAARLAGCDDYIVKPVSKARLMDSIKKLLSPAH